MGPGCPFPEGKRESPFAWRKAEEPGLPEGEWYKDFGSFKVCGKGKFPSAFLLPGQAARGKRL